MIEFLQWLGLGMLGLFLIPTMIYVCVKLGRAAWLRADSQHKNDSSSTPKGASSNGNGKRKSEA